MAENETPPSDIDHGLALLPYLSDEPLDAAWLDRGRAGRRGITASDRITVQTPAVVAPNVQPQTDAPDKPDKPDETIRRPGKRRRRRWVLRSVLTLLLLVLVAGGGTLLYTKRQFDEIERVAAPSLLAHASSSGTNYLIVGSDSRENLNPNVDNAGAIFGDGNQDIGGQRTDTIQILRVTDDGGQHMLALPRDLYLPIGGDGANNRINAAYAVGGPELLIETINRSLGIPIHHYVEIDFAGFIDLVDSVGGVTIDFPHPAYDRKTGLDVPVAGPTRLDSTQALAFVRSRTYVEVIDGRPTLDRRSDLGRVKRQQAFLQALAAEVGEPGGAVSVLANLDTSTGSVKLDDQLKFSEALGLATELRDLELNTDWDLVVYPETTASGAQVLRLDSAASKPALQFFSR